MMKLLKTPILAFVFLTIVFPANSQTLVWAGTAGDGAFFNETNWKNTTTNTAPAAGIIDPSVAINVNLTTKMWWL